MSPNIESVQLETFLASSHHHHHHDGNHMWSTKE